MEKKVASEIATAIHRAIVPFVKEMEDDTLDGLTIVWLALMNEAAIVEATRNLMHNLMRIDCDALYEWYTECYNEAYKFHMQQQGKGQHGCAE